MDEKKTTPLMHQYFSIKSHYDDALLFFQVGDFYELFFDDAKTAASFLAIALTTRGKNNGDDIPLCGVPVHALNHYLTKLIKGGFKVAICDQVGEPKPGTVVKREVSRVLTPGTLTDATMLDAHSPSYLFSFFPGDDVWGLLFSELLTAQLFATCIPAGEFRLLEAELIRFLPDEVVLPQRSASEKYHTYFKQKGYATSRAVCGEDYAGMPIARAWVDSQFASLRATIVQQPALESTLTLFHSYMHKHQEASLNQFKHIQLYEPDDYLVLDAATQKNLELLGNARDNGRKYTLLAVLDKTRTAMGSRMVKKWLMRPLIERKAIEQRQEVVVAIVGNLTTLQQLEDSLAQLADLERIIGRIGLNRAQHHDYLALKDSLAVVPHFQTILARHAHLELVRSILNKCVDFSSLKDLLATSIHDDPLGDQIIKTGFDHELDRLRQLLTNGQQAILDMQNREVARTGITSLKIGYTHVSGYYIEITNPNVDKVPADYIQYQRLSNRQRFITAELKALESDLHKARTHTDAIEKDVYERVKKEVQVYLTPLRHQVQALAYLDALFSFARVAYNNQYVVPRFHETQDIRITAGRHPVVEQTLGSEFVPNDTVLHDAARLWIITGPNMGGKSTYLRQVALICIMAQCGSLVPARAADLPILDRIFTRIGAGDDVAQGKSTFLVEMEEAAVICQQATRRSLVILDEVGRGTSTHDGMAIAQAIIEYIFEQVRASCLFATHYHELTHLAETTPGIVTFYMKSKKTERGIIFLHEIAPGAAGGSFGLEVAKLAQLPDQVIRRAGEILSVPFATPQSGATFNNEQKVIDLERKLAKYSLLDTINLDELSPRQAFDIIWQIKKK